MNEARKEQIKNDVLAELSQLPDNIESYLFYINYFYVSQILALEYNNNSNKIFRPSSIENSIGLTIEFYKSISPKYAKFVTDIVLGQKDIPSYVHYKNDKNLKKH